MPIPKPISDCEVRDPRIRRTRQLLQSSLTKLMQSRSFEEISVQDIAEEATVNRATFYDHYTDKFALLEALIAGGFHRLVQERNVAYDGTCPSAARAIILATCDYLEQSHKSNDCDAHSAFEPLIDAAIAKSIQRVLQSGMSPSDDSNSNLNSLPPETIAAATSWAIYSAVKSWLKTPNHSSAEEIVPKILQLVLPLLSTATRTESALQFAVPAH